MTTRNRIRSFFCENFYVDDDDLSDGTSLLEHGVVDSTGILDVILFLETTFGIAVADTEMVPDNLDSIAAMIAFVERKQCEHAVAS